MIPFTQAEEFADWILDNGVFRSNFCLKAVKFGRVWYCEYHGDSEMPWLEDLMSVEMPARKEWVC
jgi:hypothetical protein